MLASGAQDATIRLWNIEAFTRSTLTSQDQPTATADALLDAFEASLVNLEDSEDGGRQISLKRHIITLKSPSGRFNYSPPHSSNPEIDIFPAHSFSQSLSMHF